MSKYCSDCHFLNTDKVKYDGLYHCKQRDGYTNACNLACDKFKKNWLSNYEQQKLYDLGKEAKKKSDEMPIGLGIGILILLTILLITAKLSGY